MKSDGEARKTAVRMKRTERNIRHTHGTYSTWIQVSAYRCSRITSAMLPCLACLTMLQVWIKRQTKRSINRQPLRKSRIRGSWDQKNSAPKHSRRNNRWNVGLEMGVWLEMIEGTRRGYAEQAFNEQCSHQSSILQLGSHMNTNDLKIWVSDSQASRSRTPQAGLFELSALKSRVSSEFLIANFTQFKN